MSKQRIMTYRVLLSGCGTGGHLFPALAIAELLRTRKKPRTQCYFVGASRRMEMHRVPQAGFPIVGLWISGYQAHAWYKNLRIPFQLLWSLIQSYRLLRRLRPHAVIGTGGYASFPVVYVATLLGIPTLIHEPNRRAGRSNRWLAKRVNKLSVGFLFEDPRITASKVIQTGTPLRAPTLDVLRQSNPVKSKAHFHLPAQAQVLLVLGGSLGARPLNQAFHAQAQQLRQLSYYLLWQTGPQQYQQLQSALPKNTYPKVLLFPFIEFIHEAYQAADLVACRAGALTLTELVAFEKPALVVPSPHVAENHQYLNAEQLAQKGAARLIRQADAQHNLLKEATALMQNAPQRKRMLESLRQIKRDIQPQKANQRMLHELDHLMNIPQNKTGDL